MGKGRSQFIRMTELPLLWLLSLSLLCSYVLAEDGGEVARIRKRLAQELGLPEGDPYVEVYQKRNLGTDTRDLQETALSSRRRVHVVRSTQGIPFPSKGEIDASFQTETSLSAPLDIAPFLSALGRVAKAGNIAPDIAVCTSVDIHEKTDTQGRDINRREPLFDLMIMRGAVPEDSDILFGRGVTVVGYKTNSFDPLSKLVLRMGVSCLPYRIRFFDGVAIRLQGDRALRNYDGDITGRGKMHPSVAEAPKRFY